MVNKLGYPIGLVFKCDDGKYRIFSNNGIPVDDYFISNIASNGISESEYLQMEQDSHNELKGYQNKPKINRAKSGYIYAVHVGDSLKIGKTTNLHNRLSFYKAYSNFRIISVISSEDIDQYEKDILSLLGGKAHDNEWLPYDSELEITVLRLFKKLGVVYDEI